MRKTLDLDRQYHHIIYKPEDPDVAVTNAFPFKDVAELFARNLPVRELADGDTFWVESRNGRRYQHVDNGKSHQCIPIK